MNSNQRSLYTVLLMTFAIGCGQSSQTSSPTNYAVVQASDPANSDTTSRPMYQQVQVFINNREFGDNGCTSTFGPLSKAVDAKAVWGLTCGHAGGVSKVTWSYIRTDAKGDHYLFERLFPYKEPNQESTSKDVFYTGEEQLLFEDDVQRVVIRPAPHNDAIVQPPDEVDE